MDEREAGQLYEVKHYSIPHSLTRNLNRNPVLLVALPGPVPFVKLQQNSSHPNTFTSDNLFSLTVVTPVLPKYDQLYPTTYEILGARCSSSFHDAMTGHKTQKSLCPHQGAALTLWGLGHAIVRNSWHFCSFSLALSLGVKVQRTHQRIF